MVIHWVPGIIAAIHCISTKRAEYGVTKTLTWAGIYVTLTFAISIVIARA